jgi:hypothetical protein
MGKGKHVPFSSREGVRIGEEKDFHAVADPERLRSVAAQGLVV